MAAKRELRQRGNECYIQNYPTTHRWINPQIRSEFLHSTYLSTVGSRGPSLHSMNLLEESLHPNFNKTHNVRLDCHLYITLWTFAHSLPIRDQNANQLDDQVPSKATWVLIWPLRWGGWISSFFCIFSLLDPGVELLLMGWSSEAFLYICFCFLPEDKSNKFNLQTTLGYLLS